MQNSTPPEHQPLSTDPKFIDLTGNHFSHWTILYYVGQGQHGSEWYCECKCGIRRIVDGYRLRKSVSRSCGCANGQEFHRQSHTPEYYLWKAMKRRTGSPNDSQYHNYGGRGITVCERWRKSFSNFLADMGPRPTPKHQLERVNNEGPYAPTNCVWATRHEQCRNRRTNTPLTYKGETKTLLDWAQDLGMYRETLRDRIRRGWSVEQALETPVTPSPRRKH